MQKQRMERSMRSAAPHALACDAVVSMRLTERSVQSVACAAQMCRMHHLPAGRDQPAVLSFTVAD